MKYKLILTLRVKYILRAFAPLRLRVKYILFAPSRLRVKYILCVFAPLREIHPARLRAFA